MARVRVTHDFQLGTLRVMQSNPAGGVARDMYRRGQNVRSAAMRYVGDDTGRLKSSIHVEQIVRDGAIGVRIGSNVEYAYAHHEGHYEIQPKYRDLLIFAVGGRWIFTKRVRPVQGTKYLSRALPAAKD